jgi:transforming growth factor-beta-induced protein
MPETRSIVETMNADARFTIMATAIRAAGLDTILAGKGPFTVCAPTDDAFRHLPTGTLGVLMNDPNGQLKRILQYHVLFGMLVEKDLIKLNFPKTRLGITVEITERAGKVTINGATLIVPDICCTNGVIHGIDTVIIPR